MSEIDLNKLKKPQNKKILSAEVAAPQAKKNLLNNEIMVKLTKQEKQKIINLADQKGLKLSPFLRLCLKEHGYI